MLEDIHSFRCERWQWLYKIIFFLTSQQFYCRHNMAICLACLTIATVKICSRSFLWSNFVFILVRDRNSADVSRQPRRPAELRCILGPTQDGCALAEVLKKCISGEIVGIASEFRGNHCTKSATVTRGYLTAPYERSDRRAGSVLGVAVADCPCEDGPRLKPLPIAKSRGERTRRFPCKYLPVELGLDGFDIIYRLWTLPYNFLSRIVCATVSVIVRRRRASQARVDNPAAPRSACICTLS